MSTALATTTTTFDDRAAWLDWRRGGIGASEMAAVLGMSPFATPLDVYMAKVGTPEPVAETEAMRLGTALEPFLASEYQKRSGLRIVAQQRAITNPARPHIRATLDGVADDGRLVEFKTSGAGRARELGDEGSDEIPDHWLIQAHHQMIAAGATRCDFAVLSGGHSLAFRVFAVEFEQGLAHTIIAAADEFWGRVESRTPPPMSSGSDVKHLPALFGDGDGETVPLGDAVAALWESHERNGRMIRDLKAEQEDCKLEIRRALGSARRGIFPDGSTLSDKTYHRAAHAVAASTYSQLRFKKGGK